MTLLHNMKLVAKEIENAHIRQEKFVENMELMIPNSSLRCEVFTSYLQAEELSKKLVKDDVDITETKPEIVEMAVELVKSLDNYDGSECVIYAFDDSLVAVMNKKVKIDYEYGIYENILLDKVHTKTYGYIDIDDFGEMMQYRCDSDVLFQNEEIYHMERAIKAGKSEEELSREYGDLYDVYNMVVNNKIIILTEDVLKLHNRLCAYIYRGIKKSFYNFYDILLGVDTDYDMSLKEACIYYAKKYSGDLEVHSIEDIYDLYERMN